MGKLIYSMNVSLDGFAAAPDGGLEWATVDDELHSWFNDQARTLDATLYGRRMYELMAGYWPTGEDDPAATDAMREFSRIWKPMPPGPCPTTSDLPSRSTAMISSVPQWANHSRSRCQRGDST